MDYFDGNRDGNITVAETRQGLREAEDALRQGGSPMKGADQLIDVLDVRIHLYEKRYAGGLAEGR